MGKRYTIAKLTGALTMSAAIVAASGGTAWAASSADDMSRLLRLNPGVTATEMQNSMRQAAAVNGLSYEQAVATALAEAERHSSPGAATSGTATRKADGSFSAASSGGTTCKRVLLGDARYRGDIYYAPSSTYGVQHGHVGIFSAKNQVVEALGLGQVSNQYPVRGRVYCANIAKMDIGSLTTTTQSKAADFAIARLIGKQYNPNFAANKDGSSTVRLNCSELVWKAYKLAVGVDLDGDGGLGVYPVDIEQSPLTRRYQTVS